MEKEIRIVPNTLSGTKRSNASGIKCKKAPPIRVPAESETKKKTILLSNSLLTLKEKTPIRAPKLIKKDEIKIYEKTVILLNQFFKFFPD